MSEELPEWVDGKAFVAWLEGRRPDLRDVISESQQRTLYRFRSDGGRGSLDVVDQICCLLSLHINEIPEWIWTDPPSRDRKKPVYDEALRNKALRMLRGGTAAKDVAAILDLPYGTVRTWKARANG